MKIRTDFVTNSSSSSFIIGKKDDDDMTVDLVYHLIRIWYMSYHEIFNMMTEYATKNYPFKIRTQVEHGITYTDLEWDESAAEGLDLNCWEVRDKLEDKFGIITYGYLADDEWLKCMSYQEYQDYWIDKMSNSDDEYYPYAPFTIYDYSKNIPIMMLHGGKELLDWVNKYGDSNDENLNYYFSYIDDAFDGIKYDTTMGIERGRYELYQKLIETENIPKDKACLYILGKICVDSESGNMPEYVVDKLRDISRYGCNHMG